MCSEITALFGGKEGRRKKKKRKGKKRKKKNKKKQKKKKKREKKKKNCFGSNGSCPRRKFETAIKKGEAGPA